MRSPRNIVTLLSFSFLAVAATPRARVQKSNGIVYLKIGNTMQSVFDSEFPDRLMHPYSRMQAAAFTAHPRLPRAKSFNVLVVGLGGGTINRHIAKYYPRARQEAVELDPRVVELARQHFKLPKSVKVHVAEGRRFLSKIRRRYDVIYLDAFDDKYIPYSLQTAQFLRIVKRRLRPSGIVIANLWDSSKSYLQELQTYRQAFGRVYVFTYSGAMNRIVLAGSKLTLKGLHRQMKRVTKKLKIDAFKLEKILPGISLVPRDRRYKPLRDK